MKILHTSDWHLGHSLYKYDRFEEHAAFLMQMARIVEDEKPDAMVLSGDVFHSSSPSTAAQQLYIDAMIEIHRRNPAMIIVVTAGNHDSASRLEVTAPLWNAYGLHVVGTIERDGSTVDLDRHIVEIIDASGQKKGYIIAMPYVYPGNIPQMGDDDDRLAVFCRALQTRVAERNTENLPVVMTGHLAVTGCDIKGHDEAAGGMDYCELRCMGDGYDYLALGHIHRPQTLAGSHGRARYSGSPIPVHFDEQYLHSVSVVSIASRGVKPEIKEVVIENPLPLLTIPKSPAPFETALAALAEIASGERGYVRLNVMLEDGYLPADSMARVETAITGKALKFCLIQTSREQVRRASEDLLLSTGELRSISPLEVARRYHLDCRGAAMDAELTRLMKQVIEQVTTSEEE